MKEFRCRDVGFDCSGVIRADSDEETLKQAAEHARQAHGVAELDDGTVQTIRSKIRQA